MESIRGAVEQRTDNARQKVVGLSVALDHTDPLRMRPGMRFQGTVETGRALKAAGLKVIDTIQVGELPWGIAISQR